MRSYALIALALAALAPRATSQDAGPLDAANLRQLVSGLGFEPKVLNDEEGKEKYEFMAKTTEFDVPIAAEISGSKNYVWLTVFLGDAPKADSPKCRALLERNYRIQPCQFYVTDKNVLMMAVPLDNRGVSAANFERTYKKLAQDVVGTADLWNSGAGAPSWAQ
jgi:hypothetical protein